jgi:hypothetical protein
MRTKHRFWTLGAATLAACVSSNVADERGAAKADDIANKAGAALAFAATQDDAPEGVKDPGFKLSHNYPTNAKALPKPETLSFWKYDPRKQSDQYMTALRNYCYQGLAAVLADQKNSTQLAKWYNMPYLTRVPRGREFLHGLTRERDAGKFRLSAGQKSVAQSWGTAYYNEIGGYTLGRVWADPANPALKNGEAQFLPGTVVFKILFSTAKPEEVNWVKPDPGQKPPATWLANIHTNTEDRLVDGKRLAKSVQTVSFIQMDVAVKVAGGDPTDKDDALNKTKWIFGTFTYDKTKVVDPKERLVSDPQNPDQQIPLTGLDVLEQNQTDSGFFQMVPIGLMWGNSKVEMSNIMTKLPFVVAARGRLEHGLLGWEGRLNGPADNDTSACMSCHQTSQFLPAKSMVPPATDEALTNSGHTDKNDWFHDLPGTVAFDNKPFDSTPPSDKPGIALDYSLQQQLAMRNFCTTMPKPQACRDALAALKAAHGAAAEPGHARTDVQ